MSNIPNPDVIFPNEFKTSCFLKNVITAPNITVGDYTYYDDPVDPTGFERNNVLFNYPEFGDCQRQFEIVRKRRRNFVVFRRQGGDKIKRFLVQKECSRFAASGA